MDILKNQRVLYIFENLINNRLVKVNDLIEKFNVSEKTIYRDISSVKEYLSHTNNTVRYSNKNRGYRLENKYGKILEDSQIFSLIKVLLDSRAFNSQEMQSLIDGILELSNLNEKKKIEYLISNEKCNFKSLKHKKNLINTIWEISEFIKNQNIIKINYTRPNNNSVERIIAPVGILFSEYYFYLIAYFENKKFDSPTIFRIDRIEKYVPTNKKHSINYSDRFEESKFRERVQFMYSGELIKIQFEFYGQDIDSILDRLPTAESVMKDGKYIVDAEVYGTGIIKWILSQGRLIRVTKPASLIDKIKEELNMMSEFYNN